MVDIFRTPDDAFANLDSFPFAPHYQSWDGLRTHYLDEGQADAPVALLLHGEPTWSYLYRHMIPPLVAAGFRCIAPDHIGFGRSDKVLDDQWYVIERHIDRLGELIRRLDLRNITVFVQDWGGPIGLINLMRMPDRFARIVVMNTWLHHEEYVYTPAIKLWRDAATHPFWLRWTHGNLPCGAIVASSGRIARENAEALVRAYEAPFANNPAAKAGPRRFPFCIPFAEPVAGAAALQQQAFDYLKQHWHRPTHMIFGDADPVFPAAWGKAWSTQIAGATFDAISGAGHFVQEDSGAEVAKVALERIGH